MSNHTKTILNDWATWLFRMMLVGVCTVFYNLASYWFQHLDKRFNEIQARITVNETRLTALEKSK